MSKKLVRSFNALSRKPLSPSGIVPNSWHFDIRYVHLEPSPSHILFLIQDTSEFSHMERLPIGLPTCSSGIEFFPDTPEEAAPEVAKALMQAFVNCFGDQASQAIAPWNLTTEDKNLAVAVGDEFKKLGVGYEALHKVGVSTKDVNDRTQEVFSRLFTALKKAVGYVDNIAFFISTPSSIIFSPLPDESPRGDQEGDFELALKYVQELQRCRPPTENNDILDPKEHVEKLTREMDDIQQVIREKPEHVVKSEADNGNPDSALDYGLRFVSIAHTSLLIH
jgi:hypothetical protein